MHLLEYHKTRLEYLRHYIARREMVSVIPAGKLEEFSDPWERYGSKPITDDLITEIYVDFSNHTRASESDDYLRTLEGWCAISWFVCELDSLSYFPSYLRIS